MIEIRWNGRAGQGAKTAALTLALAELRAGRYVQAFPEYGPERSGAPMRAYTRIGDEPIRRRYGVTEADAVVVLDDSLLREVDVSEGLAPDGLLVVATDGSPDDLAFGGRVVCIGSDTIEAAGGARQVNLVMLGALAAALGEPTLEDLQAAVAEIFGRKSGAVAAGAAVEAGFAASIPEVTA